MEENKNNIQQLKSEYSDVYDISTTDNICSANIECVIMNKDLFNATQKVSSPTIDIKIKYFEGATELETIKIGDWIDCYSRENVYLFKDEFALVKLGFAMQLPEGFEAHLAPRSSTFKKWGVIQTNSVGVIDNSYCGDNDEWMMPVYCLKPNTVFDDEGIKKPCTLIKKGDKICQFRIIPTMRSLGDINIIKVDSLGNEDRGGFGSTGSTK